MHEKKNKKKQGKGSYLPTQLLALQLISPRVMKLEDPGKHLDRSMGKMYLARTPWPRWGQCINFEGIRDGQVECNCSLNPSSISGRLSMIFRARTLLASWSLDSLKLLIAHSEASEIGTDLRALVRVFDDCSWTGQMLEDDWCAILGVKQHEDCGCMLIARGQSERESLQ